MHSGSSANFRRKGGIFLHPGEARGPRPCRIHRNRHATVVKSGEFSLHFPLFLIAARQGQPAGLMIGRKAGTKLAGKAGILGGSILIFIGLEIFITSFF